MKKYLIIPILDKDDTYENMIEKLHEETDEVEQSHLEYLATGSVAELQKVVNESYDVIQTVIGILDKASKVDGIDISQSSQNHLMKLSNRGWKIKKVLTIE